MNPITRPPTEKQRAILNFITTYHRVFHKVPSTRFIQKAFLFKSQNAAVYHLQALVRRRLLNHTKGGYSLPTSKTTSL